MNSHLRNSDYNFTKVILVTGAAGYIGSTICHDLVSRGFEVVGIDNLSRGHVERIPNQVFFYQLDVASSEVKKIVGKHKVTGIVHCAAYRDARESVVNPSIYWENNVSQLIHFLRNLESSSVETIVLSSSCSVYGNAGFVSDETQFAPITPYGWSKVVSEQVLQDIAGVLGRKLRILRYFYGAGAAKFSRAADLSSSSLFSMLRDSVRSGKPFDLYGSDLDTYDGTAVRDYVHVSDLASAHLLALDPENPTALEIWNVSTGLPSSVLQVLREFERFSNVDIKLRFQGHNRADPKEVWAKPSQRLVELGWRSEHSLQEMVKSYLEAQD